MLYFPQYDYYTTWPFMLSVVAFYLLSIVVLKLNKHKFQLDIFMKFYNFTQIVLCAYMTWGFILHGFSLENPFGLNHEFTQGIEWFMFVHYVSKYLDFFDTWIMILKQNLRQLSFLHVFHHSSILLVWGFLLQMNQANGTAYFGAFLNSIVHLIMYSHYLWTSFGFTNPFKKWVTHIQMIQFVLCIVHSVLSVIFETVLEKRLAYLQFCYHIIMIVLFADFYRKTYSGNSFFFFFFFFFFFYLYF